MSEKYRHARDEVEAAIGQPARVLEPSPPASNDSEFLADDPVNAGGAISPIGNSVLRWADVVATHESLGSFARDRWLANYRRLEPLPRDFGSTRLALHRVAAYLLSPARRQRTDKIGLRYTFDGFGTPFYGSDEQLRVQGSTLVHQVGPEAREVPLETLQQIGSTIGTRPDVAWASQFDIPEPGPLDAPLAVDPASARALADWFGFAWSILEELRFDEASVDASRPQLWPEHFDPAIETGSDASKQRASYGFSPGDAGPEGEKQPYVYVGPWYPEQRPDSDYWNGETFPGAMLRYDEIVAASDQRQLALDFLRRGQALLAK